MTERGAELEDGTTDVDAGQAGAAAPAGEPAPDPDAIADGELHMLDPRFIGVERIGWWILDAIVGGLSLLGIGIAWISGGLPGWAPLAAGGGWVILAGLLLWMTARHPVWVYRRSRYAVSGTGIEIRRGIVWRRVLSVPRSRVQHTDVAQGPLLRRHGLATLIIHTAGTVNASVELRGLSYETALRIRDYLIRAGGSDAV